MNCAVTPSAGERRAETHRPAVALVTGASAGIGAAVARRLARAGIEVVLVARRAGRLDQLAREIGESGGRVQPVAADIACEAERRRLYETVAARCGPVDILVNNAGLGWYGYGCRMPWDVARQMMLVNNAALVHLTLLYLPGMQQRGYGHIINIGSIAGSMPNQGVMLYSATKAFADAFTTALHRELRGSGVQVSIIRPGPVHTEFYATARNAPAGLPVPAERFAISPDRVADCVMSVLRRPRRVAFVPRVLWLTRWIEPFFDWFIDRLGPRLLRRAGHRA